MHSSCHVISAAYLSFKIGHTGAKCSISRDVSLPYIYMGICCATNATFSTYVAGVKAPLHADISCHMTNAVCVYYKGKAS